MEEVKKYSKWEYDEEEEQDDNDENQVVTPDPNEDEDPNKNSKDDYSDDTPLKVKIDGQVVEMTAKELADGYMRQSDYTRKTQELSKMKPEEKKEVIAEAKTVVENPDEFTAEEVKAAEILLTIGKKKFGLMTREDFEAEENKKRTVSEFSTKLDNAKSEVSKMKGMPAFNEEEIIDFMQETGIHDPYAAYLRKNDAQYRDFIIKQAKGDTSYKSDKGGKKVEPNDKPVNVRTEEGHRSFLKEELHKMQEN